MSAIRPFIERVESGQSQKGQWRMLLKDRVKYQLRYWLYKLAKGRYNTPILKRYAIFIDRFSDKEVEKTKAFRFPDIAKFYQSNHDRIMNLYESYRSSL